MPAHRLHPITHAASRPLWLANELRAIEQAAQATLPPHTLMQRAGLAVGRLALALAPHAQRIWLAAGPGNNGGDALEAALFLAARGKTPVVTLLGDDARRPADAAAALQRVRAAGLPIAAAPPDRCDLIVDGLLGLGAARAPQGTLADWIHHMQALAAPVLAIDLPSGLASDSGTVFDAGCTVRAQATLALIGPTPGLFTGRGRDHAGQVWVDDLGLDTNTAATGRLSLLGERDTRWPRRAASSHKGSHGDVLVLGGAPGMTGAAVLAAQAALHAGAGRVYLGLLHSADDAPPPALVDASPELMLRRPDGPDAVDPAQAAVVCGCGGGTAVQAVLPRVLSRARALVLDADALNAIAADDMLRTLLRARGARQQPTVLTPHPLEAGRLLGMGAAEVQANRLRHAAALAADTGAVVVLKGSGSVIASPDGHLSVNPTGNARLATAGTGDVLAGLTGALLARGLNALQAARCAVWHHGLRASQWPAAHPFSAGALARAIAPKDEETAP